MQILATLEGYPASAKHLRIEALKLAIYRSQHLLAQYALSRGKDGDGPELIGEALQNLGEEGRYL